MKRVMHRLFWAWDFEKEENWLNEMSAIGLQLTGVGLCRYTFIDGTPGEYAYKLEYLKKWPNHPESVKYIRFLEETGIEHIESFGTWVYLRKKVADGAFDIYSDLDSRIKHYRRINFVFAILGLSNLLILVPRFVELIFGGYVIPWPFCVSLGAVLLMLYGYIAIERKVMKLKKERRIRE